MMINQCPICLKQTKLDKHHWWEDNTYTIGHIRWICHYCNMTLHGLNGDDDHVLPEWEKQIEYVQRTILLKKLISILRTVLKIAKETNPNKPCHPTALMIVKTITDPTPHCPNCWSTWIYYRKYREKYYCRICRHSWSCDKEKVNVLTRRKKEKINIQTIDKKLGNSLKYSQMARQANTGKPRCPKCNSAWIYYRQYREEWICRTCQHTWKDDNKEREVNLATTSDGKEN